MDFSVQQIEQVASTFFQNPASQPDGNEYLMLAQASREAWGFAWELLVPLKPVEVQFYAANTIHIKISRYWTELETEEQRVMVKERLMQTLLNYLSSNGPRIVQSRLCVAVAALVVQTVTKEWPTAVPELMTGLQPDKFAGTTIEPSRLIQALLELLTMIPEELLTAHINGEQRRLTKHVLVKSLDPLFKFLQQVLVESQTLPVACRQSAIKCFTSWTQNLEGLAMGESHDQIINYMLGMVCDEDLCASAVESITVIYCNPEMRKFPRSVLSLVEKMVALEPVLKKTVSDGNQELAIHLYTLFIQIAEAHSRLLLESVLSKTEVIEYVQKLVTIILQCTATPGIYPVDEECSILAFNFWYTFHDDIMSFDAPTSNSLRQMFSPLFMSLVDTLLIKAQYPDWNSYEKEWTPDEKESFRCYRQDISDTLSYLYGLFKPAILASLLTHFELAAKHLVTNLEKEEARPWQHLESTLFAFGTAAENTDHNDETYIRKLFQSFPAIPFAQVSCPRLLATMMELIGSFCEVLPDTPDLIPIAVQLLVIGLRSNSPLVTIVATLSLKDLSRECQIYLKPMAENILASCNGVLNDPNSKLGSKERARLMCTVGHVLSVLPVEAIMQYLNILLPPLLSQLEQTLSKPIGDPALKDEVLLYVNMLGMLFGALDINLKQIELEEGEQLVVVPQERKTADQQPVFIILQQVLPLLSNVGLKWASDEIVIESLCEGIKRCITTLLEDIKPFVPSIMTLMMQIYAISHHASTLDIYKHIIILFARDTELHPLLSNWMVELCNHSLELFHKQLRIQTALIEAFYQMCCQILRKGASLYENEALDVLNLFRCATSAILLPEKPTVRSSSQFLCEFIHHSRESERMLQVVNAEGETLLTHVFLVIGGSVDSPRSCVEHMVEILIALNQKYFDNLSHWLKNFVAHEGFPTPRINSEQKQHFSKLILKERKNKRKLKEIIGEMALICRGLVNPDPTCPNLLIR